MISILKKFGALILFTSLVLGLSKPFFAIGAAHEVIHSFQAIGDIGGAPYSPPIDVNGTLYGVTSTGSTGGCGAIYSHNDLSEDVIAVGVFEQGVGCNPHGSLVYVESQGALYGMALNGGDFSKGTIFKYNLEGALEVLYSFGNLSGLINDGAYPYGSLTYVEETNSLYGMTSNGGENDRGTIFSYSLDDNSYKTLFSFSTEIGAYPYGSLTYVEETNSLYGMTSSGGIIGDGVVFSFKLDNNQYQALHSFGDSGIGDGSVPRGSLTLVGDTLYGVTSGDPSGEEVIFSINVNGEGYTILHSFFGEQPKIHTTLVFDGVRKLYGTTVEGGSGSGSIFSFDILTQTYTVEDGSFDSGSGGKVYGGLMLVNRNGIELAFYGTTVEGGSDNNGTLFKFSVQDTYIDSVRPGRRVDVDTFTYIVSDKINITGVDPNVSIPISVSQCTSECAYFVNSEPQEGPTLEQQEAVGTVREGESVWFVLKSLGCGATQSGTLNIGDILIDFYVDTLQCSSGGGDVTPPEVSFSMPATGTSLTTSLTFSATDNTGVTGYKITTSSAQPSPSDSWSAIPITSYTFDSYGTHTLYAWAKDDANNISSSVSATITLTEPAPEPEPTPDPSPNNNSNPRSSRVRVDTTTSLTQDTLPTPVAVTTEPIDPPEQQRVTKTIPAPTITILDSPIKQAIKRNFTPAQVEVIEVSLKAIVAFVTAIGGAIVLASVLFLNPLASPEFILIPIRLWGMLLAWLGLRKKPVPWGTVYDSITKQPVDPVRVSLIDMDGKVVESSITDTSGRYGFAAPAGIYKVVLSKTNYLFPSHVIADKDMRDELYDKPYFGDYLPYDPAAPITKNIPIDPLDFDTAVFAQKQGDLTLHYSKRELVADRVFNSMFLTTFLIVAVSVIVYPQVYNLVVFGTYIAAFVIRHRNKRLKQMGRMYDLYGKPLAHVTIKVHSALDNSLVKTISTTRSGRYYLRVPKGLYYLRVERKTTDGLMVPVYQSPELLIRYGLLNKVFNIAYS